MAPACARCWEETQREGKPAKLSKLPPHVSQQALALPPSRCDVQLCPCTGRCKVRAYSTSISSIIPQLPFPDAGPAALGLASPPLVGSSRAHHGITKAFVLRGIHIGYPLRSVHVISRRGKEQVSDREAII